ncbi:MAG: hypothetical protein WKF84_03945 [Pyrinomonadaceae bacterium]
MPRVAVVFAFALGSGCSHVLSFIPSGSNTASRMYLRVRTTTTTARHVQH